jgi:DNA topoisomerase 2-associated protein PAT1
MSFFGLPEPQKYFDSRTHKREDTARYNWVEENYYGLGDALQEGDDELNDETFGGTGPVGECVQK